MTKGEKMRKHPKVLVFKKLNMLGIAELVPSKARNLLVCFSFASQPLALLAMTIKKDFFRNFKLILIAIFFLSCTAKSVQSTVMLKQGLGDLVKRAETIFQGKVRGISHEWNSDKTMIFTTVRVSTERILKGPGDLKEIVVRQPGGMIGDKGVKVSGYPDFFDGEEVILFVEPFESKGIHSGKHRVVGMAQGKFRIETDPATAQKIVRPSGEMPILLNAQGQAVAPEGPVLLEDFIRSIEQELPRR